MNEKIEIKSFQLIGRNRSRAQATVEFALILPIALLMVFTIIEIARMVQALLVVQNSARIGLRYAVTGAYESGFCTFDANDNDLYCAQEPDNDARDAEIDAARLLSIYDLTEDSAVGISKDLSVSNKDEPRYFNVTVCSTNKEPEPDGVDRVYNPPPDDTCSPFDHPGDPTNGPARVLVAVTFEHPVILPILNKIAPSVTLHSEKTGIVEQFRVARVLGLPPVIEVPTATGAPPTITETPQPPTATLLPTPVDCSLYTMSGFGLSENNVFVTINNNNPDSDVAVVDFQLDWDSAHDWAPMFGVNDLFVDRFLWGAAGFYDGDDYAPPSSVTSQSQPLPAGSSAQWLADFSYENEDPSLFANILGLTADNFGYRVVLDNECVISREEVYLEPPEPNCDLYSISEFSVIDASWAIVGLDITNGDQYGTVVERIEFDWDYADTYDNLVDPNDDMNVDWFRYDGVSIWGGDNGDSIRDYDSTTSAAFDSASGPAFIAGGSHNFQVDFDGQWDSFAADVLPEDFGVTIEFVNECVLSIPAVPRPIVTPTPDCDDIFVTGDWFEGDDYRIRVRNNNLPPAYLVQSVLSWPAPRRDEPYVNYLYLGSTNNRYYETNTNRSPLTVNLNRSENFAIIPFTASTWGADFSPYIPYGEFCGELTYEYVGWGTCTLGACETRYTPTATPTSDPRATATSQPTIRPTETNSPPEPPLPTSPPRATSTPRPTRAPTNTPDNPSTPVPTDAPTDEPDPTNTPWPTLPGGG